MAIYMWREGRAPDASRTIYYYEFENNLNDSSGNNRNITSGSSYSFVDVGGQYVIEDQGSIDLNIPSGALNSIGTGDFTLSFLLYPIVPTNITNRQPALYGQSSSSLPYPGPAVFYDYYGYGDGDVSNPTNLVIRRTERGQDGLGGDTHTLVDGWHHFCMARRSGTAYCYIDNVEVCTFTSTTNISSVLVGKFVGASQNWSPQGWGTSGTKGDKLIVENVGWTSHDVSVYFNQIKSLYGIN